jgi:repressor LexA
MYFAEDREVDSLDDLTTRQIAILDFIKREIRVRGYPPSVREIGEAVGLSSSSTVHNHLSILEQKGYIRRDPTKPRAIEILDEMNYNREFVPVPLVGKITAGEPILAAQNIENIFPIPYDLIKDTDVFMLSVQGDSMVEAGIFDGDLLFIKKQSHASNGDIVAALIEDEATIKTFYKETDYIRLQPENNLMKPIITKEVRILGKVIGVFRLLN